MIRRKNKAPGTLDGRKGTGTGTGAGWRNRYPVAPDEVVETHQEKACIFPSEGPVDTSGPVRHLVAGGKPTFCPLA